MKQLINVCFWLSLVVLVFSGCRKDGPFKGKDNDIASFQLTAGNTVLTASIQHDSIFVTAPGDLSLLGAKPAILISERAQLSPDPSSITDWAKSCLFTVTAYNGTPRTYIYTLLRNVISKDGDILLMTQADVDTLAKMHLGRINGSLTIGRPDGPDSIRSLTGLSDITSITGELVINPTYAGKDLKGLDNLATVGTFRIGVEDTYDQGPLMNLKTIILPKLTEIQSKMILNGVGITTLDLPELTKIGLNLQINFVDSLTVLTFPKLQNVTGAIIFQGYFLTNALKTVDFPALTNVGGDITINTWTNLETVKFPALIKASSVSISGAPLLTSIEAAKLQNVVAGVSFSANPTLTVLNLSSLQTIGGDFSIDGSFVSAVMDKVDGLKSLTSVGGSFNLYALPLLTDIGGLKSLQKVGGNFTLGEMALLKDLSALSSLQQVGGVLSVQYLAQLADLNGFSALKNVQRVGFYGNPLLVDFTGLKAAIPSLTSDGWTASDNQYNPSFQDILDGKYVQ